MRKLFTIVALFFSATCIKAQVSQEWAQTSAASIPASKNNGMAKDNAGNIYVAGSYSDATARYMSLQKYDASGNLLWTQTYVPAGINFASAHAVAIDANGDVIITGRGELGINGITRKYDANGQLIWSQTASFSSMSIATDENNNIYLTSWGTGTEANIRVIKYNSAGVQQWMTTSTTKGYTNRVVYRNGAIYATGLTSLSFPGKAPVNCTVTIKFDAASGSQAWAAVYSGDKVAQYGFDLVTDAGGNSYMLGLVYVKAGSVHNPNWLLVKYNSAGVQQWSAMYDGNANDNYNYNGSTTVLYDYPYGIVMDGGGNLILTGASRTTSGSGSNQFTSLDMATVKFNSSGTQLWAKTWDSPTHGDDYGNALATDASANIYVTGNTGIPVNAGSPANSTTIKLNSSGVQQWVMGYDGGATVTDNTNNIVVDGSNVYVAGKTGTSSLVIKYSQAAPLANPVTASSQSSTQSTSANDLLISNFTLSSGLGCDAISTTTGGVVIIPLKGIMTFSEFSSISTKFYSTSTRIYIQFQFNGPNNTPVDLYKYVLVTPNTWNETGNLLSTLSWIETFNGSYYSWSDFVNEWGNVMINSAKMVVYEEYVEGPDNYIKIDDTRLNDILLNYDDCDDDNVIDYIDCDPTDPGNQKIKICHNGNTICVGLSAVQAHLNHGDYLGLCISASRGVFTNEQKTKPTTEQNAKPGIHVYPNPATTQITISSSDDNMPGTVTIYDALGNKVYQKFISNTQTVINVKNLPSGVYYLRSDQIETAIKFVKQ